MSTPGFFPGVPRIEIKRTKLVDRAFFLKGGMITIIPGDTAVRMRQLPDNYFQCAITSPPYYGLRSYLPDNHPDKGKEIGSESDPREYVTKMVTICREVYRCLRHDGVFYLNIGDTYQSQDRKMDGLKHKDLIGIPWMLAFALRDAGWYLRSEIIWHKNKIMPESANDRPSNCHEKVFMFTKSEDYFWDSEAVREEATTQDAIVRGSAERRATKGVNAISSHGVYEVDGTRNIRNVWTMNPNVTSDAHYALMPEKLVELCVMSGSSELGCCSKCGAPWCRVIRSGNINELYRSQARATGQWQATCNCENTELRPCAVLDPFGGIGTTGLVAAKLARNATIIELGDEFIAMTIKRLRQPSPGEPEVRYELLKKDVIPRRSVVGVYNASGAIPRRSINRGVYHGL